MNAKPATKPSPIRNARGQLLPGVILNPKGRPKGAFGARNRAFLYIAELIEKAQRETEPEPQSSDA